MSRRLQSFMGIWKSATVTVPASGSWSTPVRIDTLGNYGRITRLVVRAPASSNWTAGEVRVFQGAYSTSTDPSTVPDEDLRVEITGASVAGSATAADIDENIERNLNGAIYDTRSSGVSLWISVKSTAGTEQTGVTVQVEATDCNG